MIANSNNNLELLAQTSWTYSMMSNSQEVSEIGPNISDTQYSWLLDHLFNILPTRCRFMVEACFPHKDFLSKLIFPHLKSHLQIQSRLINLTVQQQLYIKSRLYQMHSFEEVRCTKITHFSPDFWPRLNISALQASAHRAY